MRKVVYIVDDEPGILSLLQIMLSTLNSEWEVQTFEKPMDLLEKIRSRPPHIVISDQCMPGMTGTVLQEEIRKIAPATVRLIISGYPGSMARIASAHQFLSKPFDIGDLNGRLTNALLAQEGLNANPALVKIVSGLRSFPVLPEVYNKLIKLLESETTSVWKVADLLRRDGGTLTRVLHLANSPLFSPGAKITEPEDAINCLGTRHIKSIVLSVHLYESFREVDFPKIPVKELWDHSWVAAQRAQDLCRQARTRKETEDSAFFAGLVHHLGQLILMENFPEEYRKICEEASASPRLLCEVEKAVLGISSAKVTRFLLQLWGISEEVYTAVEFQDEPWALASARFGAAQALYMAKILSRQKRCPDSFMTGELNMEYLSKVGAPSAELVPS